MAQNYDTVTVTTTATKIVGANGDRLDVILSNVSAAQPLYFGPDDSVTAANGAVLKVSSTTTLDTFFARYKGDIYGITAADTADIRYWENANR